MLRNIPLYLLCLVFFISGCSRSSAPADRIKVSMKKYAIEPAVIHVKSGSNVQLEITTADVQHGFDVPALGIKEPVQPGKTTTVNFVAPAKGEYKIVCGVICGPHHEDMVAKLVVD
ncbi:MAG TPA: cupredoxin domain-containing protein [Candidatus Angelobacter sp.]